MENKKLLFFDIDGTLLAGGFDGYVPDSAIYGLKKAQENGHLCFINSGRTKNFLPKAVYDFPFDGYVLGCGTQIVLHGKTIFHKEVPLSVKKGLIDISKQTNMQIVAEGPDYIYYDEGTNYLPDAQNFLDFYAAFSDRPLLRPMSSDQLDFEKFVVVFDQTGNVPLFKELIAKDFQYIDREGFEHAMFSEIVPLGCSKATGIDFLVDYFGLSLDDVYVFGDGNNDLPMLTHVKHSIAMGNSFPGVIGNTEYVTSNVDDDGILNALKHYNLI